MLDDLYDNIGEKIKGWAKWIFIIEAISAVICGFVLIGNDNGAIGVIVLLTGPFVAWVGSWLLYAFGELVEKTVANEAHTKAILQAMQDKEAQPEKMPDLVVANKTDVLSCEKCKKKITHYPCEHCGHQIEEADAPYWCGKCGYLGPFAGKCPKCNSGIKIFNTKK